MSDATKQITEIILKARDKAFAETSAEPEPGMTGDIQWPVSCTVGPGLEGAIACETKVGYVNGAKGWLVYRGFDIFELSAHATFEETCFLLLHDRLPNKAEKEAFEAKFKEYRYLPQTLRRIMSFPIEEMASMAALRLGTNLMRQEARKDHAHMARTAASAIGSDEDSIPMETKPRGEAHAIYEFEHTAAGSDLDSSYHLIASVPTLCAAISRIKRGLMPIDPDPALGHAANFLYMLNGRKPTEVEERLMDVILILHADHGMNASTFASMVVASTLSDIYLAMGAGIAALSGPLHGGANEEVVRTLREIGSADKVPEWFKAARAQKKKIMGFGHRVYKAYDPRARVLEPLAEQLVKENPARKPMYDTAKALEREVLTTLGAEKKIFPNVDFYSGIVFDALGIEADLFAPIFAVSRMAGWTARVLEYLEHNRIFRPRAIYQGEFGKQYVPVDQRG